MKTWTEIRTEFIEWDKAGGFNASQKQILDWFKEKIPELLPDEDMIKQAILELGKKSTAPDKETPDWLMSDIRRGMDYIINRIKDQLK